MDEIDTVLRLIRIDWDDTQNEDYNPLELALNIQNSNSQTAMSYNNIYHKVEQALSKVIELSFKGFSESLIAYKQTHRNTNESLEILNDIKFNVDKIKESVNINIGMLEEKKAEIDVSDYLTEDLEKLSSFRDALYSKNDNLNEEVQKLVTAIKIIKKLRDLKPIAHYISELDGKRRDIIMKIADALRKHIFLSEKLTFDPQLIFLLDCYDHLEKCMFKNSSAIVIDKINTMILRVEEEKLTEKQQMLADQINDYLKRVLINYDSIVNKLDFYKDKGDNYFEKEMSNNHFFLRDKFILYLKNIIHKLVEQCTVDGRTFEKSSFNLDEIEDTLDYEKLLGNQVMLKGDDTAEFYKDGGFYLVDWINFQFIFYLYRNSFEELRTDLFEFLKHRYFSVSKEKIKKKLDKTLNDQYYFKRSENVLKFTPKLLKAINENCFFDSEFGYGNLQIIYEGILNALFRNLSKLFTNRIVMSAFEDINKYRNINLLGVGNNGEAEFYAIALEIFKRQVTLRRSDPTTLFVAIDNYKIALATSETIRVLKEKFVQEKQKFEKLELNPELEELYARMLVIEMLYKCAFDLQILADIVFLFWQFITEGKFGNNNIALYKIIDIFRNLHALKYKNTQITEEMFVILSQYIMSNLDKINVKSVDELKVFISDMKLLEEIVCNFEMEYMEGFEAIYVFFMSIIDNNLDTEEKRKFARKLN